MRGCIIVSRCSLCDCFEESSLHLFLNCYCAIHIWNWLSYTLNFLIDCSSVLGVIAACNRSWSSQLGEVILAAIAYTFWGIWHSRNSCRFQNNVISCSSTIAMIKAGVKVSGNLSHGTMLKAFSITCHARSALVIKQIY